MFSKPIGINFGAFFVDILRDMPPALGKIQKFFFFQEYLFVGFECGVL